MQDLLFCIFIDDLRKCLVQSGARKARKRPIYNRFNGDRNFVRIAGNTCQNRPQNS